MYSVIRYIIKYLKARPDSFCLCKETFDVYFSRVLKAFSLRFRAYEFYVAQFYDRTSLRTQSACTHVLSRSVLLLWN